MAVDRAAVAENRRRKTRRKLIEAALGVIAVKGFDGQIVDDVVRKAGVSRATYYNYFKTSTELVLAIAEELINELISLTILSVDKNPLPFERHATGARTFMSILRRYPRAAAFLSRTAYYSVRPGSFAYAVLERDVGGGMEDGSFSKRRLALAMDLVVGPIISTMGRMATENVPQSEIDDVVYAMLLALGADPDRARRALAITLAHPRASKGSLLEQTEALDRISLAGGVTG
ncbi:MAG TPA: TetR/AcrR family transcriptional regulator [Candidatus Baltobacteraceae bacterium]|nr:TetR/AcrR family transcriptional regulator [Candidatus Baltobacteraceae bacterium]